MTNQPGYLPPEPYLVRKGNRTIYKGSRSYCMTKLHKSKKNGDRVEANPKFAWIKEGKK